jgi:hypothetical protein
MTDFDSVLEFLDNHTLDPQLYWQVRHLYDTNIRFEVQWCAPNAWRFKPTQYTFWYQANTKTLLAQLNSYKLDLDSFQDQVVNTALEQIVGAHLVVLAGRELFGDGIIDGSIIAFEQFREELSSTIDTVLKEKQTQEQKAKFKVIREEDE